uniref:Coatomer subunit zeta n=1 Tax=Arundo donax TaxID=35708 RepID=A0A0A9GKJ9_ARUDO
MADFSKESCPSVKIMLLLDSEGKRVAVKYFSDDWPTNASKLTYEKSVFTKTLKTNARTECIFIPSVFHAKSNINTMATRFRVSSYVVAFSICNLDIFLL